MITLNELTLRKFRIHDNLTLQLRPGVTGIIGKNGTGKSSIIEAIGFLFTGEADDAKSEVITAGANGTSFVRGSFTLNGKQGTLERALDTSRIILEYDGHKMHKAGEVKEFWAKLLQIDPHIFQHVIVAKQKKIPELFSGETAVRERAFQRIFMLPNTERVRTLIWDSYLKVCPPPLPEDDLNASNKQLAELRALLAPELEKLALISASTLSESQMLSVINYIEFYNRCITDASRRPALLQQEQNLIGKLRELREKEASLTAVIQEYPTDLYKQYEALLIKKEQHRVWCLSKATLAQAKEEILALKVNEKELTQEVDSLEAQVNRATAEQVLLEHEIQQLKREVEALTSLTAAPVCPTCNQPLQDVVAHLLEVRKKQAAVLEKLPGLKNTGTTLTAQLTVKKAFLANWVALNDRVCRLSAQENKDTVQFDEAVLTAVVAQMTKLRAELESSHATQTSRVQTEASLAVVQEQIKHLVAYEGDSSPAEELTLMQEVLQRHRVRLQEISEVDREVVQYQTEIQLLEQRQVISAANHTKNLRRSEYTNKLRMAYDALHTSQFPRQLVRTYSSVVEDELQQQLQRFELPYQARISEEFRIVITKEGNTIPRLSGGQEMVVGLCLRLALHAMFSQAFPMLIIDEGTTHLDEDNRKLYFQCIDDLKRDKVIQQLIIIDHCSTLVDVVDNVIRL